MVNAPNFMLRVLCKANISQANKRPPHSPRATAPLATLVSGLLLAVLAPAGAVWAQTAGEVEFSRGVGFAQIAGQTPRTLGKGLPLQEGDRLTTAEGATAIIKLQDGTRMTVRPNSELVLQQFKFKQDALDNSMVMQLLRGGLRAVTGLIAKSSPNAARIRTNTATIGIRGTDFDARLCTKDCAAEAGRTNERSRPNAIQASAKIVGARGEISAVDSAGLRRRLVDGGSVYPGDVVETGSNTQAVLAFRDESRVALGSTTRFRLDNFVFDNKAPSEGRFLVSLLKGSVRALSGLIAKANTRNVGYSTSTATIGIRGTEFGLSCTGECATEAAIPGQSSGLRVYVYAGEVALEPQCTLNSPPISAGTGTLLSQCKLTAFTAAPGDDPASPSLTPVPALLFSGNEVNETQEGLYVFVRDGHIEITSAQDVLHLGRGEAGFAGPDGTAVRPNNVPRFIDFDRTPLPGSRNPTLATVLGEVGVRESAQCR